MSKLVAEYLQHPLSASANIALLDDGNVGGVLGATLGSKLDIAGGKILQIVRATDTTQRSTTSTTLTDITNMSVTITPQKNNSAVLLVVSFRLQIEGVSSNFTFAEVRVADSSNNLISGAESTTYTQNYTTSGTPVITMPQVLIGYSTPATISATTYKVRASTGGLPSLTVKFRNEVQAAQLFAIEVSA